MPVGLPAERVRVLAEAHGVPNAAWFWERFGVLEHEALRLLMREHERVQARHR